MKTMYLSQMKPSDIICGIYKINYPNGKSYIGQSQNIRARLKEHNSYAKSGHGSRELLLCEKKMKEYNYFIDEFELLEEVDDLEELDNKEKYWIEFYHTYIQDNQGYNKTKGGDASGKRGVENVNASLNQEQLNEVVDLIQHHPELSFIDIGKRYGISQSAVINISTGRTYTNPNLNYPLRRNNHEASRKNQISDYFLSEEELIALKEDLLYNWELNIETDLPKKYNIPLRVLRDINQGRKFQEVGNFSYPIRAQNIRNSHNMTQQDILEILNLLRTSKISMKDIGKKYNFGRAAIANINNGMTYIIKNYDYPARKTN